MSSRARLAIIAFAAVGMARMGVAAADEGAPNACGCRKTDVGACICEAHAKCGCPGECEPRGCEERRQKAFEKEVEAETRKAEGASRKRPSEEEQTGVTPAKIPERPAPDKARLQRQLTPGQAKQLVRLLDLYFSGHDGARAEAAGALRDDVARVR